MNEFQDFLDRYVMTYRAFKAADEVFQEASHEWLMIREEAEDAGLSEFLEALESDGFKRGFKLGAKAGKR
jgi:hypothetical protein